MLLYKIIILADHTMSHPGLARVVAMVDNVQDVQYPLDYSFKAINRFQGMKILGIF